MKFKTLITLSCLLLANILHAQEFVIVGDKIFPIDKVQSIKASWQLDPNSLYEIIKANDNAQIYRQALDATSIADTLKCYMDSSYKWASDQDRIDSCTWTNNQLCIHTAVEYDNVAYPEKRYFQHTMFICPDSILKSKYGITTLDDLRKKAKELYEPVYPEDSNVTDETDRRNYLNRFISYHILNRYGTYYTLTCFDNYKLQYNFNRRKKDICDWYETIMPHSIMKFSFPSGLKAGLYINRRGVQARADERGVFVRGVEITSPDKMAVNQVASNGIFHYIDDIIAYDKETQTVVLNECIRLDCTTLSPDFMTRLTDGETARGHSAQFNYGENNYYGRGGQGAVALTNSDRGVVFKPGYVRNVEFDNKTHLHVRGRVLNYWSYQADEVTVKGKYDVKVKLPPVPAGTYEVRLFTCTGFASRGIIAFSIDNVPTDIVDMRPGGGELFGNKSDSDLGDPDAIAEFDRAIHNNRWMKGPKDYEPGNRSSYAGATPMRDLPNTIRRVVGRFTTDGKSDHYLRMQQLMESSESELNFDFIELVPSTIYDGDILETPW